MPESGEIGALKRTAEQFGYELELTGPDDQGFWVAAFGPIGGHHNGQTASPTFDGPTPEHAGRAAVAYLRARANA